MAILLAADLSSDRRECRVPLDDFVKTADDKAWFEAFYPAFMENATLRGKTYAIPFQRSTPVLYWNKDLFKAAGPRPRKRALPTGTRCATFAKKLTKKDASGNVTRWGLQIPSDGNTSWLFTGVTTGNGVRLTNPDGNEVVVRRSEGHRGAAILRSTSRRVDGVQPSGLISWGTAPRDFLEGKAAMIWHTTGNLTNIKSNATFPFGVAICPDASSTARRPAAAISTSSRASRRRSRRRPFNFVKFMTAPERAAAMVHHDRLCRHLAGSLCDRDDEEIYRRLPAGAVARDQLQICRAPRSPRMRASAS